MIVHVKKVNGPMSLLLQLAASQTSSFLFFSQPCSSYGQNSSRCPIETYLLCSVIGYRENGALWQIGHYEAGKSIGLGFVMTSLDNLNMKLCPILVKSQQSEHFPQAAYIFPYTNPHGCKSLSTLYPLLQCGKGLCSPLSRVTFLIFLFCKFQFVVVAFNLKTYSKQFQIKQLMRLIQAINNNNNNLSWVKKYMI